MLNAPGLNVSEEFASAALATLLTSEACWCPAVISTAFAPSMSARMSRKRMRPSAAPPCTVERTANRNVQLALANDPVSGVGDRNASSFVTSSEPSGTVVPVNVVEARSVAEKSSEWLVAPVPTTQPTANVAAPCADTERSCQPSAFTPSTRYQVIAARSLTSSYGEIELSDRIAMAFGKPGRTTVDTRADSSTRPGPTVARQ